MRKLILCSLVTWVVLAGTASARFGETPEQCLLRYGRTVTNLAGYASVDRVAVHTKGDLFITIVFFKGEDKKAPAAGLILYSMLKPLSYFNEPAEDLLAEDEKAILATVEGSWKKDGPTKADAPPPRQLSSPKTLNGTRHTLGSSGAKVKPITTSAGITADSGDKLAKTITEVLPLLYFRQPDYTPVLLGQNGPRTFAYRVLKGIVICSSDKVPALAQWAAHLREENAKPVAIPKIKY